MSDADAPQKKQRQYGWNKMWQDGFRHSAFRLGAKRTGSVLSRITCTLKKDAMKGGECEVWKQCEVVSAKYEVFGIRVNMDFAHRTADFALLRFPF